MANERECIVCGKPRFLIEGMPYYFHPLVCTVECAVELDVAQGYSFQFSHEIEKTPVVAWTLGYERSTEDYLNGRGYPE